MRALPLLLLLPGLASAQTGLIVQPATPPRGVTLPPTSAALVDEATALSVNPAGLRFIGPGQLFYLHERAWRRVRWGQERGGHARAVVKGLSWRAVGTADTFFLSWLITGHLGHAASIASFETVTKVVLFYLHEQLWRRIAWGRSPADEQVQVEGTAPASA